jgi:Domain of unknown function (DUF397)
MDRLPLSNAWRTSSRCNSGGCVAAALSSAGEVLVRDSTFSDGPILRFSAAAWQHFATSIRDGEFRRS